MPRIFLITVVMFFVTFIAHWVIGSALSNDRSTQESIRLYINMAYGLGVPALILGIWNASRPEGRRRLLGSVAAGVLAGAVLSYFAIPFHF